MAYTGIMAKVGFNLVEDTLTLLFNGAGTDFKDDPIYSYLLPYVFLRDVDSEPIILEGEDWINYGNKPKLN